MIRFGVLVDLGHDFLDGRAIGLDRLLRELVALLLVALGVLIERLLGEIAGLVVLLGLLLIAGGLGASVQHPLASTLISRSYSGWA